MATEGHICCVEVTLLWGAGRGLLCTWRCLAIQPKKMCVHYVQQTFAQTINPWLHCFAMRTWKDPLPNSLSGLTNQKKNIVLKNILSQREYFSHLLISFFIGDFSYCVLLNQICGYSYGFSHWMTHLRSL